MEPIESAMVAIIKVLNVHENHLYPKDVLALQHALDSLVDMKSQGFK